MQIEFSQALLDPELPVPDGVIDPKGRPAGRRYNVYRNNVVVSLSEALAAAFPVVQKLVGEQFFTAMAGVFVRQHPPKTPLMIYYGDEFPDFLRTFPPVAQLPYLPDVAQLEYARRLTYHSADADPCPPDKLALLQTDGLENRQLTLHPSLHILRSEHPIFSIWRLNSTDDQTPVISTPEIVMISRPAAEVTMNRISDSAAAFIEALQRYPLGEAADRTAADHPQFDITENLTAILQSGLLIDIN